MTDLAAYANELLPGTPISANDCDCTVRNAYLIHGIDLHALAQVQDVTMIENFGLPRWDADRKVVRFTIFGVLSLLSVLALNGTEEEESQHRAGAAQAQITCHRSI